MATILITGAARGLGYELARQLAGRGHRVLATCRDPRRADTLRAAADASGGTLTVHAMDVGSTESVKACRAEIGDMPVDILVNNAGVWGGLPGQVLGSMDYDNWAHELNIMLMGPFRVVESFLPNILASGAGRIVSITSQTAAHSYDHVVGYAYASAKAGTNRVMTALAQELGCKGVTVVLLHPGWIRTEMAGAVADLEPDEAAAMNIAVIEGLTPADNGKFLKWTGDEHAW
ncbi:SDR family NAD(P)-dependent oxidoreductase [Sphingomonas profundi]|uniref:SDR family NAD(P)-dependent oxidoreductase n=1 Tax=Alterirhizorhabdus profundi TaxID=2681549 RepID=UPI0012E81C2F|nr:SDR family NAD(P)-dependent oxidoreductase [Sphingomonas profundi]